MKMFLKIGTCICLLSICLPGFSLLYADIQVSPNFLFMDSRHRSIPLRITNTGNDEREVWVETKFGYETSDDAGKLIVYIDSNASAEGSAARWIESYPRRFIVGPGETQTVRIVVTPPAGLSDGEYWARVVVTSKPRKIIQPAANQGATPRPGIVLYYQLSVPFHYRVGKLTTGVIVDHVSASIVDTAIVVASKLTKTGNAAFWGTRTIKVSDKNGKVVFTTTHNTGVYTTIMVIDRFNRSVVVPGQYTVDVEFVSEKRLDVNKKDLVKASPVHASTTLMVE